MREIGREDGHGGETAGTPWIGLGATVVGLAAMAAVVWTAWPDLPEAVDNDTSGVGPHGGTTPRGLLVAVMPLVLVGTGVLFLALAAVGRRLSGHLPAALRSTPGGTETAANAVPAAMAVLLTPVHAAIVLNVSGTDLPTVLLVGLSVGAALMLSGAALVRAARSQAVEGLSRVFTRTGRPMGAAVASVGAVQIVVVLFTDEVTVAVLPPLLLVPAMGFAFALPFLREGIRLRSTERDGR